MLKTRELIRRLKVPVVMSKKDIEELDYKIAKAYKDLNITLDNSLGYFEYYQNGRKLSLFWVEKEIEKCFKGTK